MLVRKLDVSLPAHVVLHHGDRCPGRSDHQENLTPLQQPYPEGARASGSLSSLIPGPRQARTETHGYHSHGRRARAGHPGSRLACVAPGCACEQAPLPQDILQTLVPNATSVCLVAHAWGADETLPPLPANASHELQLE